MPRTKAQPRRKSRTGTTPVSASENAEVLTLAEAAAYLRVAEADLVDMVQQQDLPGRRIGGEWRFLKPAMREWLRTPPRTKSNEALVALAGAWKDDPDLEAIVNQAYRNRGRPITKNVE